MVRRVKLSRFVKFLFSLLCFFLLLFFGTIILATYGNPGNCQQKSNEEKTSAEEILQEVNRLIDGSISTLTLSDRDVTGLMKDRLSPDIEEIKICFSEQGFEIAGKLRNRSNWVIPFYLRGQASFEYFHLNVNQVQANAGSFSRFPLFTNILSRYAENIISGRLGGFTVKRNLKLKFSEGFLSITSML